MYLTRHATNHGARWAADGKFLTANSTLALLFDIKADELDAAIKMLMTDEAASGPLLAPIEHDQEVWASGVTYLRSRVAREAESETSADVYERVYDAERPELFAKAAGWRVRGPGQPIRIRKDSGWNVPEPELTLAINCHGEIIGYTAGNDVSSRDIEGENPLYLPQAKVYNGSAAMGEGIVLGDAASLAKLPISVTIERGDEAVFSGETNSDQMKRTLPELASYLTRELDFPYGVFLMTGTGIVPEDDFTLQSGDVVRIRVGKVDLENRVE